VLRRLLQVTLAGVVGLLTVAGTATHAYAVPSPEELERQIEAQWRTLEPVIEEYNAVTGELKLNREKAAALQRQLDPLESQVNAATAQVNAIAIRAYKGGQVSAINALLSARPGELTSHLSQMEIVARNQRAQVSDVAVARDKFAKDKKALDDLIAQQSAHEAELAAKKQQIEAEIKKLEQMQRQANGGGTVTTPASLRTGDCPSGSSGGPGDVAARTACAQIGDPYVYAAEGPDKFDCSGLTLYAWKAAGRTLPHNSAQQLGKVQKFTDAAQLRVGDLVFFYSKTSPSHVALYVGGGNVVHASRAGVPVRMKSISGDKSVTWYGHVA
jgi:peptidoglycan DL-endopeptidase CwlO